MRDIRRPPKQPAQRANSKTPPTHSKPPSQKTAQLQYSKAEVKVIKGESSSDGVRRLVTKHADVMVVSAVYILASCSLPRIAYGNMGLPIPS
jgi:hypothetical protein